MFSLSQYKHFSTAVASIFRDIIVDFETVFKILCHC